MKTNILVFLFVLFSAMILSEVKSATQVGLHRTFELSLENNNAYTNKFNDVELTCTYISPSGDTTKFMGFYDGDGMGGGDAITGNIWKLRFLPNEVGEWNYKWSWSDTTPGGEDTFLCDSTDAGKGVIRPYENNPRWFAYNGTDPVWIKSYYESGHGAISQQFDWITENVYQPMIDRGYNHLLLNWLLSLCCFNQYYADGPAQSTTDLTLYQGGNASSTMRLDVWQLMEQNVSWLNDRNIGLHMFLGFDGGRNGGPAWTSLSESEKDFYVRYVIARLAPYANIAGWTYVWEVPGDREEEELGWARLVQKYDVFDHLRTYQDEKPKYNEFHRPEYNFAGVENHRIHSDEREPEYWASPWSHHEACLMGYVPGKPVYMVEGNSLWRRYWSAKIKKETGKAPTMDEVRQSAWACVTAGASFTWCGHQGEGDLMAFGEQGLPFYGDVNVYASFAMEIDILTNVMNNELNYHSMTPSDSLLFEQDTLHVWCLSEPGNQYLVFAAEGSPFKLQLEAGQYNSNQWINTTTGAGKIVNPITATANQQVSFTPPDTITDWVLLVRREWEQNILEESNIISAETDTLGTKLSVKINKELTIPAGYTYGFTIESADGPTSYSIKSIALDMGDKQNLIIELNETIFKDKLLVLGYLGTLSSTDSAILAPIKNLLIRNNSIEEEPIVEGIHTYKKGNCSVFPNPCTDYIDVSSDVEIDIIRIFDTTGKLVLTRENIGQTKAEIPLADLQQGMYLLHVTSSNYTSIEKLLKR